ncbi:hypothetical protein [Afipia felis]|uniref:Uncharacterized protein n=2 Tax=Afipia felis TaxID=1035 RepID=A0A380WCP9_AFIFE|nr:hypothetical protein [Afipia felis]EKS29380.1 hypothetical protein HMPREF9697_01908 [Afipia felis ATCC 53690]SUU78088.1 Uncharacterised protein [Afipia felis]SUU86153.1 Uncharacterised protein [Afipia felis]
MTATLSPRALSIISRHKVQDSERIAEARIRTGRIRDIREQERDILRRTAQSKALKDFEGENPENSETVKVHGPRASARNQQRAFIAEEQRKLDLLCAERSRLEADAPPPVLTATRLMQVVDRGGDAIAEIATPELVLAKGERNLIDALPRFRENVSNLKARRREIEKAPLPAAHVKKTMRNQVARIASQGVPQVGAMFHGGEIGWPRLPPVAGVGSHLHQPIDASALAVFLHRDLLIERLDEIIDVNAAAFPNPMSPRERQTALDKIDAEIDAAERVEAACVEALVAEGHRVFHRPDISVLAVISYSADISF